MRSPGPSLLLGAVLVLGASGTALLATPLVEHRASFEEGWDGYVGDHHIACQDDPADPCPWNWELEREPGPARDGVFLLHAWLDGVHDDGAVWAERSFAVPPGLPTTLELRFHVFSEAYFQVNNWPVLGYVGAADPEREEDLLVLGETNTWVGWRSFCLAEEVVSQDGSAWVGFGTAVTWEGPKHVLFDLATVRTAPAGQGCAPLLPPCESLAYLCDLVPIEG